MQLNAAAVIPSIKPLPPLLASFSRFRNLSTTSNTATNFAFLYTTHRSPLRRLYTHTHTYRGRIMQQDKPASTRGFPGG